MALNRTAIQLTFDKAIALKEGEVITLRFDSYRRAMSVKTQLMKERKKFTEKFIGTAQYRFLAIVTDTKEKHKGIFKLHLAPSGTLPTTRDSWVEDATVHTLGGKEEAVVLMKVTSSEAERIKRLREEDSKLNK